MLVICNSIHVNILSYRHQLFNVLIICYQTSTPDGSTRRVSASSGGLHRQAFDRQLSRKARCGLSLTGVASGALSRIATARVSVQTNHTQHIQRTY